MKQFTILSVLLVLGGCSSETPRSTEDQKKAFSGGPMPEDWKKRMSSSQNAAAAAASANQGKARAGGP
jgi:hypothetical protein